MDEQWLTTEEAGKRLGKTDRQVRRDCHNRILDCKRDGKQLLVDAGSVEALLQKQMSEPEECPQEDVRETSEVVDEDSEDTDIDEDADTPEESITDANRIGDIGGGTIPKTPADIAALSEKLRTSIKGLRKSHKTMSETADLLFQRLCFEFRRNRDIESRLQVIIEELNIQPNLHSSRRKALRYFKQFLPWVLFVISVAALLLKL